MCFIFFLSLSFYHHHHGLNKADREKVNWRRQWETTVGDDAGCQSTTIGYPTIHVTDPTIAAPAHGGAV